jgi:hypothetical protein
VSNDGYASFMEYLTQHYLSLPSYAPEDFLYGHNGPCPQVARDHPFGQAPEILDIPDEEKKDWNKYVNSYYTSEWFALQLYEASEWRRKRLEESGGHGYVEVSDARFTTLLTEGLYSKFLCEGLDPTDVATFGALAAPAPGIRYWKSDYSCMEVIKKTREGTYLAPTVVLLKETIASPRSFEVVAIALSWWDDAARVYQRIPEPLIPDGSEAWRLAKFFVLQGAIHRINLIDHGKVHFPSDVINAITKTALPKKNLVFQLLEPHFWLTLPVNNAVLEGEKSLINRYKTYDHSPFVAEKLEIRKLLALGWYGWRYYSGTVNSAYPPYKFETRPPVYPSNYGDFLTRCYDPILAFVSSVLAKLPATDTTPEWIEIQSWAAQISGWLPGFPEWTTFRFDNAAERTVSLVVLAETVATIIHNAAVIHSCDHSTLHYMINNASVPFILRVPPPRSRTDIPVLPGKVQTSFDALKNFVTGIANGGPAPTTNIWAKGAGILCLPEDLERICWADLLFYRAHNTTRLIDCEYKFTDPDTQAAVVQFRGDLARLSTALAPIVKKYNLPWLNTKGRDEKFKKRHCVGAGIQY